MGVVVQPLLQFTCHSLFINILSWDREIGNTFIKNKLCVSELSEASNRLTFCFWVVCVVVTNAIFQEFWYYEEVSAKEGKYGHRMTQRIPTLEEWLNQFGHDPRIRLIWLDVKVNVESKLKFFTDKLISLLNKFHITKDRLQFSVREVKIGALLQVNFLFIYVIVYPSSP